MHTNLQTLKSQRVFLFVLVLALALLLAACAGGAAEVSESTDDGETGNEKVFTLAELAEFDGQDGRSAYIAVDGVVYDVSDIPQWAGGSHAGGTITAGKDYSVEIRSISPHGTSMLSRATKVGVLAEE